MLTITVIMMASELMEVIQLSENRPSPTFPGLPNYVEVKSVAIIVIAMVVITSLISFSWGFQFGIEDREVVSPDYRISAYSARLNTTEYNWTYHWLTENDVKSDHWVLDIPDRNDYFLVAISVEANTVNWSRFSIWVESYEPYSYWNLTIELVSINTRFSSGSYHQVNFYNGASGGTMCDEVATVYVLGYGALQGLFNATAEIIHIRGYYQEVQTIG